MAKPIGELGAEWEDAHEHSFREARALNCNIPCVGTCRSSLVCLAIASTDFVRSIDRSAAQPQGVGVSRQAPACVCVGPQA